jgi:hypothetical protein
MRTKRVLTRLCLFLFVCLFAGLPLTEGTSFAVFPCDGPSRLGRADCHGYFTNYNFGPDWGGNILNCTIDGCLRGESLDNEIPDWVNNATDFENLVGHFLGRGYSYNHAGAAFIIDAMLGKRGSDFGTTNAGINYAVDNFNHWKDLVSSYGAHVDWNVSTSIPYGEINSMHACDVGTDCSYSNDFVFYQDTDRGGEPSHLIVFHNKDGSTFEIRRECANLVGELSPISDWTTPPRPSCAGMTVNPGLPDPKMTYRVTANVDYQDTSHATTVRTSRDNLFIHVNGPGVSYNNDNVGVSQSGRRLSGWVQPGPTNHTGTYNVDYGISGPDPGTITCRDSFYVTDQPVFHTSGGDTDTGAGMTIGGVDCAVPADPKAGLVGWNLEAKGNYAGAGTQYAAFAMNHLQDYATAQDGTAGGPYTSSDPTMLAFANDAAGGVNVGAGLFGGQFGGGSACVRDYFSGATGVLNGNITIGGRAIANSTSQAIYVKGNVYITGDITFSDSYANIGEIPSFNVIVEGNIYIAPGVKQLDGLYVAEPTTPTRGGIVYTCASAPFVAQPLDSGLYNKCSGNSLTFNGAVVARQLWLLRANGTVSDSGTAAENVNFTPEIWLTTPPDVITGNGAAGTYNAITSLPPVL